MIKIKSIKRVKDKDGLEQAIEDKQTEGFQLKSSTGTQAYMVRPGGYGSVLAHLIIFVVAGWWTLFLANIVYACYKHISDKEELYVKIGKL